MKTILRKLANIIARAELALADDSGTRQTVQARVLAGEVLDHIDRPQDYGFTSHPHPGAEAVLVFRNGNRSDGICVAVDDRRYRLKGLEAGEVAMYDDQGNHITFKRDKMVVHSLHNCEITAPVVKIAGDLEINGNVDLTGDFEQQGDMDVTGKIDATGNIESAADVKGADVKAGGKSMGTHTHTGDSGGSTGPPL